MTSTELSRPQEERVRDFYDDSGEAVAAAYLELMVDDAENPEEPDYDGHMWWHGDPAVEQVGGSLYDAKRAMLRSFTETADLGKGKRVFEFGSGAGGAAVWLAEHTGATVVGASNTDSLQQHARRLAARREDSGQLPPGLASFCTIGDEDYKTLSAWPDNSADAFLFMESPCHLPAAELPTLFAAASRIVKPGGWLLGQDWLQRPWGPADDRSPMEIDGLVQAVCETYCLAHLGTLDRYTALIAAAGFRVESARDMFVGQPYSSAEPPERWKNYRGPARELIKKQWQAMNAARRAQVFTVGTFAAQLP